MTDRNPQEGPSFRTSLDGSPLILVVQFTGVHGNKGIIINTGFKFSHEEWELRGGRPGAPGRGPRNLRVPPGGTPAQGRCVDLGAVLSPVREREAEEGSRGDRGLFPQPGEAARPVGAELIYQKQAEGRSPQALPAHSRGAC